MAVVHAEYLSLFELLEGQGISFCLLRDDCSSGELLPDLDLLVQSSQFQRAIEAMESAGYCVRTTSRLVPLKTVLVRPSADGAVIIDLHSTVAQNCIELLDGDAVIERSTVADQLRMPSDPDLYLILLLHNVVGKGEIQQKHAGTIGRLYESVSGDDVREVLASNELHDAMSPLFIERVDALEAAEVDRVRRSLIQYYESNDKGLARRRLRQRVWSFVRRYYPFSRAPLFALTGVDGAGKSTLLQELVRSMNEEAGIPTQGYYMGPWGHHKLGIHPGEMYVPGWHVDFRQWISGLASSRGSEGPTFRESLGLVFKRLRGQAMSEEERKQFELGKQNSRLILTFRFLRSKLLATRFVVVTMLEMYARYWRVYRLRRKGIAVVADRYIYDLMTGRMHDVVTQYARTRRLMCWLFPRPTAVFVLYNDAETILGRKADLDEKTLDQHLAMYIDLAERNDFDVIKTDKPANLIAREIVEGHFEQSMKSIRF